MFLEFSISSQVIRNFTLLLLHTPDHSTHQDYTDAPYAVAFYVPSITPFEVLDLSYVLVMFMNRYIRSGTMTV
ncbi:hypothetical protein B0H17DRAFT_1212587 [Mycena rosella]|uniref:Uncharacterized protein n=1 Tax=Mycena rosella TaxID=1033263 RepID=A0AAD7CS71_MYCRO|nr:hypothetical protein B0H17DRAFT_1212587 [Mycena rosella]